MYWPYGAPSVYSQDPHGSNYDLNDDVPDNNTEGDSKVVADNTASKDHAASGVSSTTSQGVSTDDSFQNPKSEQYTNIDNRPGTGIIGFKSSRSGHVFATITSTTLTIWQSNPTVILASIVRAEYSVKEYGFNVSLMVRPDGAIIVIQTSRGFLITYSLASEPESYAYRLVNINGGQRHGRRKSVHNPNHAENKGRGSSLEEGKPIYEASLRFRMVIKLDAGISSASAQDEHLVIATHSPPAVQCIRWTPDQAGNQTSTVLLSKMDWLSCKEPLRAIVYDRPMNLYTWITSDGGAHAVQRITSQDAATHSKISFRGHQFHFPTSTDRLATSASINSKFSLIALACNSGIIIVYSVRDYSGGITELYQLPSPFTQSTTGNISTLLYAPDGHCLFAGFEKGWTTWSTHGQIASSTFYGDRDRAQSNDEQWLLGVQDAFWTSGGSHLALLNSKSYSFAILEFARSALTTCLTPSNVIHGLLLTSTGVMMHSEDNKAEGAWLSNDSTPWRNIQVPHSYLSQQWPLRIASVSADGRYVAVAGQRGLAHYSCGSGRWKTFEDPELANEFQVRGLCWHQHILIAAVDTGSAHELRLYSRESSLDGKPLHIEVLDSPVVSLAPSGDDSILVFSHDNFLDHYIVAASRKYVRLVKVGQIGLQGIVRAPARVRALSWIVPEHQLQSGDPSQDVALASVLFLLDDKLVMLQPTMSEDGDLKYDMRIIANNVEYYLMIRDTPPNTLSNDADGNTEEEVLRDSLWYFDGQDVHMWTDIQDLLAVAPPEYGRELPTAVSVKVDFYPLSPMLNRGTIFGIESELVQTRDTGFAYYRPSARSKLFLPHILRHYLARYDNPAALHLSHQYQSLPYFPHALEVLLHYVLDDEVENLPDADSALLPRVLSFLSSFPEYLDVIVQCTRKTELRSWRPLFAHLPDPRQLFERSLADGALKTASGYLLVLHTLSEIQSTSPQVVALLSAAKKAHDWEICKELARFLMALDESGTTLKEALRLVEEHDENETTASLSRTTTLQNGAAEEAESTLPVR